MPEEDTTDRTTHFGYQTVTEDEKTRLVRGVFDRVASRYDLMNDLMSGGVHRLWKREMVALINPRKGQIVLDLGGGTGDIAFRLRDAGAGEVTVCDINAEMLAVGRDRAIDEGRDEGLTWVTGDAEQLPFPNRSFEGCTIAFALRNVTRIDEGLRDSYRILKPGSRFVCLEFSKVVLPGLQALYDQYSFKILPVMGRIVAKDRDSYQYLAESIRKFPPQAELAARMEAVGFSRVGYRNLSGGIAALHWGWRI